MDSWDSQAQFLLGTHDGLGQVPHGRWPRRIDPNDGFDHRQSRTYALSRSPRWRQLRGCHRPPEQRSARKSAADTVYGRLLLAGRWNRKTPTNPHRWVKQSAASLLMFFQVRKQPIEQHVQTDKRSADHQRKCNEHEEEWQWVDRHGVRQPAVMIRRDAKLPEHTSGVHRMRGR